MMAPLAEKSLLLDGAYVDGLAVVVGERGHVLISEDQGRSWRQVEAPTAATLTGVRFHDRNLGWAVGHDATILRTRDGGETWERVYHDPEEESPLFDVWFSDADNGFAVGAYGLFLVTADGGSSWERQTILETVLLFGLRGHVFRSEDEGETWEEIETGTVAALNRGLRTSSGTVIIAGHDGTLLRSDDEGRSFTRQGLPDREALARVLQTDDEGLILIGEFGVGRLEDVEAGR